MQNVNFYLVNINKNMFDKVFLFKSQNELIINSSFNASCRTKYLVEAGNRKNLMLYLKLKYNTLNNTLVELRN